MSPAYPSKSSREYEMCEPATAIAGAGLVFGVGSSIAANNRARANARDQAAYNARIERQQKEFRREVMNYKNDQYEDEIEHYEDLIEYQQEEFEKSKEYIEAQEANVKEDAFSQIATLAYRMVEEETASLLRGVDIGRQVLTGQGSLQAQVADSGIAGNTVRLLSGEIDRQGGEANVAEERNLVSVRRQLGLSQLGIKAAADSAMARLRLPTFQPLAPPAPPTPTSPVNPAAPVARPSSAAAILSGVNTGLNIASGGIDLYNTVTQP